MKILWFLSGNPHKLAEYQRILAGFEIRSGAELHFGEPPEETGSSFWENALLKLAPAISARIDRPVFAEDTGLCCPGLEGAPGLHSARWAGVGANDRDRRRKLLAALGSRREAYFGCALAFRDGAGRIWVFEGRVEGIIVKEECGTGGFGYGPIFQPRGFAKSFGEMTDAEKDHISHRAMAATGLRGILKDQR